METFGEQLTGKINRWKQVAQSCSVEIVAQKGRTPATVYIQTWSRSQRQMRALKALGIWWGVAIISVLVPIAHFILVPLFFLVGLIAPIFAYFRESIVLGGIGTCPICEEPFEIVRSLDIWPLTDICSHCHNHVTVEKT